MFHSPGLSALLALGLLTKRVVAVPTPLPRNSADISWSGCESFGINSTDSNLQCAYLEVPMDYHDSSAGTARLAVAKYSATTTKLGTIFFNPGGPGGSGVTTLAGLGPRFSQILHGAYDIVSWDPRGVGVTVPGEVHCFTSSDEDATFWQNTVVSFINETISGKFNDRDFNELYSQVDPTEQKFKDFANHCQNGPSGQYLKYIGTTSTVRDLVSLGDAIVGPGQPIDYWGVSYGTVIGFNFLNMFPDRAGRVILDGVVDPAIWITYKMLTPSLVDVEKTYSGLTDACAAAGTAGCKLIEFIGDNASGDAVKTLINDVHDLTLEFYRDGVEIPAPPGALKLWLFNLLYNPQSWSEDINTYIYEYVGSILQTAQLFNVTTITGKYNMPSETIGFESSLGLPGAGPSLNLTTYALTAISGADNFNDGSVTIKDVFDVVVSNTRNVTPTFGTVWGLGYVSYAWPVRSVEQIPPFNPQPLKTPVLVIGNSADPVTPFASAQNAADLLGDNAFLIEQLGFGHSSLAQVSSCTQSIVYNYFANSTLPQARSSQCQIDSADLFPALT